MEVIQELVGERGNILLVREGYTFYKQTVLQNGEIKWRCCKKKCLAKMYTFGIENQRRVTKENVQHNHDKDEEKVKRKIVSGIAKRKAVEDSSRKPSEIIQNAIDETKIKRMDITHRDVKLIARNAYNARRKEQSLPTLMMDHSSLSINLRMPKSRRYLSWPTPKRNKRSKAMAKYYQLKRLEKQQEAQAADFNIQVQETSGPSSTDIKQEITIDETDLDHLNIPKLETFENTSVGTDDGKVEVQTSQETLIENSAGSSNAASDKFHSNESDQVNQDENHYFLNIIPKLEPLQNTSEDISRVEENYNSNIFPSTSYNFHQERKTNDNNGDLLNTVQGEVENGDKYVEYGMYIANRLRNANQSDSAFTIVKQEIEVILNDFQFGIFNISSH